MRFALPSFAFVLVSLTVASSALADDLPPISFGPRVVAADAPPVLAPDAVGSAATHMNNKPLFIVGTALASVGTLSAAGGGIVVANGKGSWAGAILGLPMLIGGGALTLTGIPMMVVGSWRVRDEPKEPVALRPQPFVGVGSAGVRMAF
jgi:hypothetical protein